MSAPSRQAVIDAEVHHQWPSQRELVDYLPSEWQAYLRPMDGYEVQLFPISATYSNPSGDYVSNAEGGPPSSDWNALERRVLSQRQLERAILSPDEATWTSVMLNKRLACHVAQAINDWCIDRWLNGGDKRLYSLVTVPNQWPEAAAAEIRRVGRHPRMVGVAMGANGLGVGFGHPAYQPIYEAAMESDLPIVIRADCEASPNTYTHPSGGGIPATYSEYRVLKFQSLASHLTNFISEGTFDRFTTLKLLVTGAGATWISTLMWKLDYKFEQQGREIAWVRKSPSAHFHDRVKVGSNPLNLQAGADRLRNLLESTPHLEDMLCYCGGYPYWDFDRAEDVAMTIPESWREKVLYSNARSLFRWPD
jgi:predicted TIM-barrel fold metal-dependent hydrolase